MATCAVVQLSDGVVINKIVAEPIDLPPMGCQLIPIDGVMCDFGWIWDGVIFINPNSLETFDITPSAESIDGN